MKSFKKICIIRDDRLGDAILTLPIINKLKKTYKNSKITLVISPISAELVKKFDFFDNLIVSKNNLETLKEINQNNFDLIINFAPLKNKFYKLFLKSPLLNSTSARFLVYDPTTGLVGYNTGGNYPGTTFKETATFGFRM